MAVARTRDKVQVMRTESAAQAARHNNRWYRQHRARPCQERKDRAPAVVVIPANTKGGPPRRAFWNDEPRTSDYCR